MTGSGSSDATLPQGPGPEWTVPGYTHIRELGSGGGGRVVVAVHDATGQPVAVKYLNEALAADDAFRTAFRTEAHLLGGLRSPHVTGLYEYVEAPEGAAIVMELVEGVPLRALIRQEGPTGPEAALLVLKGSLLGLADAHRAGVVHRDYKPANVLVTEEGSSKLVDFGIAGRGGDRRTGVSGTPPYMAPEQWNGAPATPATDVYAATVTFFECLTGEKPFAGESLMELALRHTTDPVPDERVPQPVRGLVRHGMAKAPEERPRDAAAFLRELEEVAGRAYGPGWEERGRGRLASLAALLPLLIPRAAEAEGGIGFTDAAVTTLPGQPPESGPPPGGGPPDGGTPSGGGAPDTLVLPPGNDPLGGAGPVGRDPRGRLATAGALVVATLVVLGSLLPGSWAGENGTTATATTAPTVPGTTGGPSASPSGGSTASPSGPATPGGGGGSASPGATTGGAGEPSGSWWPSAPTGPGSGSATETTPHTGAPTTGATTGGGTAPPGHSQPPPATVRDVTIRTGWSGDTLTGRVTVTTDGEGPVGLSAQWYAQDSQGAPRRPSGSPVAFRISEGGEPYTVANREARPLDCRWYVLEVTTVSGTAFRSDPWYADCLR
ncbi:serine/threonine-protein kinase [Streptomyces xinghaiensis]|uniref:serine/threonine-protein kinase n=1 Tax=Streptomyces xinghaiensis TaxID=1038928 RepID=UPI000BAF7EC5|nr:serine/threonine-protein kinase [Streptomyces xinghaiensis]